jgi:hypothetical protein
VLAEIACDCQAQRQMVDEMQADGTHVAQRRRAFELMRRCDGYGLEHGNDPDAGR